MKFLIVLGSLIFSTLSSVALADGLPNFNIKDLKSETVEYKGVKGIWFNSQDADKILQVLEIKLPEALQTIKAQDIKISALQIAVDKYKSSNEALTELANLRKDMVDTILNTIKPPEPDPWYKSSEASFICGAVVGAVVIFASTYTATKALSGAK